MTILHAHLPHRGVLELQGEDKATFLQGLISNDIHQVTKDRAIYATLLNPQGRFLYDFFIIESEGSYFLDCEAERLESLVKKLSLYKLRSQVSLTPRPDLKVFAVWNEDNQKHVNLKEESINANNKAFIDPRLPELGARIIGKSTTNSTPEAYDLYRIVLGVPESGRDLIPEKSILLESGLDELNAISWTKGCFIGQELTARTKHVGQVRKRLFPVEIEGDTPLEGSEIFITTKSVGTLRSTRDNHGIALLRITDLNGDLFCGNTRIKPYTPFWMQIKQPQEVQ